MRLTHKHKYKRSSQRFVFDMKDYRKACQKLGQLEDIEELCEKIVSQPVYEKCEYTDNIHEENYIDYIALYNFKEERIEIFGCELLTMYYLKDYGKTWALTRKELENDK